MIRLVTFDALHTLITPRLPIHVQYSQAFKPYLGEVDPGRLKSAFKVSLKQLQQDYPAYAGYEGVSTAGKAQFNDLVERWWGEVIRRSAVGAGAQQELVDTHLSTIVPKLMKQFSSRAGYKFFGDALPTIERLHEKGLHIAVISNSDSRIRSVLKDLELPDYVNPIVLSEEERIEKPSKDIFRRTIQRVSTLRQCEIQPGECLHVGDELEADYHGAIDAGMQAVLLRREGEEYDSTPDAERGLRKVKALSELLVE